MPYTTIIFIGTGKEQTSKQVGIPECDDVGVRQRSLSTSHVECAGPDGIGTVIQVLASSRRWPSDLL